MVLSCSRFDWMLVGQTDHVPHAVINGALTARARPMVFAEADGVSCLSQALRLLGLGQSGCVAVRAMFQTARPLLWNAASLHRLAVALDGHGTSLGRLVRI